MSEELELPFHESKWRDSIAYRDAKVQQIEDKKAGKTILGLIRDVSNGGEKYVGLQGMKPTLGF